MRKVLLIAAALALWAGAAEARERAYGFCTKGGVSLVVSGISGTPKAMASYPSCTVTVYVSGTVTLATLYSDNSGTPLANPFTANSDGYFAFYADDGRYDAVLSGAGFSAPFTLGDILLNDPTSPSGNISVGSVNAPQVGNINPVQIGSVWYPGSASGSATNPALAPTLASESSGNILGTLGDGTYRCVYTYANRNGETLQSPEASITLSGGTSTQKFYARLTDYGWMTGAYKFRLYCGTASGGPYYRQVPANVRFAVANNGFTRATNVVTVTFSGNHPFRKGQSVTFTGATGCATSVNAAFTITDVPSATTVTFAQTAGNETCGGASAIGYYNPALTNDSSAIYSGVLGLADFIVDTVTLSGTQPPSTNTATIDPLQVVVNKLHNLTSGTFTLRMGSVELLATTYTLTTPLVCYECVLTGHSMSFQEQASYTGTLITSSWNDVDLGTVMFMGPHNRLSNLGITATGTSNGGMIVGGSTNMNGQTWDGVFFSVPSSSTTVAGLRIHRVNVSQNNIFLNVTVNGGRFVTHITNASFGPWSWDGGRSNCGSDNNSSALTHWAGPIDYQRGAKIASDSIPSAVALTWADNVVHSTESCKGIVVDFGGGFLRLGLRWNNSDGVHVAGTEAIVKLWSDNWSSGSSVTGFQNDGTIFGSGNVLATIKMGPGAGDFGGRAKNTINGFVGGSTSSGSNVCVDFNNIAVKLIQENTINTSGCSPDPNADASNGAYINVPASTTMIMSQNANAKDSSTGISLGFSEFLDRSIIRQSQLRSRAFCWDIDQSSPFNLRLFSGTGCSGTAIMELFATGNHVKIGGFIRAGTNPADASLASGSIIFGSPNNLWYAVRNAANNADVNAWRVNSSNIFEFCDTNCVSSTTSKQIASTLATGTAPFSITSTTVVPNLNVSQLLGKTWATPDPIGNTTPNTIDGTTITATGAIRLANNQYLSGRNFGNSAYLPLIGVDTSDNTVIGGTNIAYTSGPFKASVFQTSGNCSSNASPASCSSASAGSVVIAAGSTTVTVNTSIVTANSQITLQRDDSLGTKLSVTCNTQSSLVLGTPRVTSRTASTSFVVTIDVAPTTNPMCLSYMIVN